ncbi:MAG: hypothetical protein AMS14_02440 [Planctomycetes bacterium DG_20]|nr:MAG: hypothetical protein AMS14_02440 [Planctomycetes bacterium DG_20]
MLTRSTRASHGPVTRYAYTGGAARRPRVSGGRSYRAMASRPGESISSNTPPAPPAMASAPPR